MFFFYIILSVLVGAFAHKSGRSMGLWVFISIIISPIFSAILLLINWLMSGTLSQEKVIKSTRKMMFGSYTDAHEFVSQNYELDGATTSRAASDLYRNAGSDINDIKVIMSRYS